MLTRLRGRDLTLLLALSCPLLIATVCQGNALDNYVKQPDASYHWKIKEQREIGGVSFSRLEMVSQKWRGGLWRHELIVARPKQLRNPDIAFLLVSGSGKADAQGTLLKTLAERAGAVAVVVTEVPNQPLYDGRKEDQLIAYSFAQYLKTGDETWPLLFPMVKSAVRSLDTIQEFAAKEYQQKITRFVVGGASKRGWTTWLTGAVDSRVTAMAPMVFDMLNMRAQTEWTRKVYGHQSEKIHDYTEANLIEQMDAPQMKMLRDWIDPYSYRDRYTMPKLILLGTNDPYWTVDSLRHYFADLPGPKLIQQTPNAGHSWGGGTPSLAAFFQMVADRQPLPKMEWQIQDGSGGPVLSVQADHEIRKSRLWTATSETRDFRKAQWSGKEVKTNGQKSAVEVKIDPPASGYRAYMVEVEFRSANGHPYKLCTEARVTPDNVK